MTIYLHGGWYKSGLKGGLRNEVLDGAMDTAGLLHRAGLSPELVSRLALRVRSLVRLGENTDAPFGSRERDFVADRLESIAGDSAEIISFIADCLDNIKNYAELAAFYLHLVHIARMMQLLTLANLGPMKPTNSSVNSGPAIGVGLTKKTKKQTKSRSIKKIAAKKTASKKKIVRRKIKSTTIKRSR
ncbi:MAG: hypothetical protein JW841_07720 [Deltaproteobacteria bacterium]|nr:hypothetical protein [Deltaproteobacteria bacterium]